MNFWTGLVGGFVLGSVLGAAAIAILTAGGQAASQMAHDVCWCLHHREAHDVGGLCCVEACECTYYIERRERV